MSGLSLASHPRLAGAGRHRFGANQGCLRAPCVLVLRARPCGGFACFASCRSPLLGTRVLLRSHILLAHALWRGRSLCSLGGVPCWGLLWACLLAGGWGSCLRAGRVRAGVCVLACVRFGGVVGQCGPAAPLPRLACLRAHASGVGLLACARLVCARWAEGGQVGAGHDCPAPLRALVALSTARCVARKRGVVGALMVC